MCLLSDTDSKPGLFVGWWWRGSSTSGPEAVKQPSFNFKQWLRVSLSAQNPMLPVHAEREKVVDKDKREVLYALVLGAPLAILTSAAGLHVIPDAWAWVASASVGMWILAASGTVLNQYSQLDCERLAARHLGQLGVLGAALLFCFFTCSVFFPSLAPGGGGGGGGGVGLVSCCHSCYRPCFTMDCGMLFLFTVRVVSMHRLG
ncbi:unnamed protein product [Urochloa humidicola]